MNEEQRRQIADFLPHAIYRAVSSYHEFMDDERRSRTRNEPVQFKEHHTACKVALAHIDLLFKLAREVGWSVEPDKNDPAAIERMLLDMEKDMKKNKEPAS